MHNDLRMGFKDLLYELDTKTVIIIRIKWYFIVRLETVMREHCTKDVSTLYPPIIYTHYIYSVVVQDYVSGWTCCVNQYHYESR